MSLMPPAPGPGWQFAVPPTWPAPPGFDPRRGHVADPTWPPAPPGWQFWVKASNTPGARAARTGMPVWLRFVIGIGILAVLGARSHGGSSSSSQDTGYAPVDCADSAAAYKVIDQVANADNCPTSSGGYLDSETDGPTRYQCLEPVTH